MTVRTMTAAELEAAAAEAKLEGKRLTVHIYTNPEDLVADYVMHLCDGCGDGFEIWELTHDGRNRCKACVAKEKAGGN